MSDGKGSPGRTDIVFDPSDQALRDDVRTLGALVGAVLREQGGEALYEQVETVRKAAIARRTGDPDDPDDPSGRDAETRLADAVAGLAPAEAEALVRAFSTYFQVVNLAERVHRVRRRRDYLRTPETPQPGSPIETVRALAAAGLDADLARATFGALRIEPVFTAHPTEATRRTLLAKQQRIARALVARLDPARTPVEERTALDLVRAEVTAGWQTEEHPGARPTVADEREHILFYLTDVLYRVMPDFYRALEDAIETVYDDGTERPPSALPPIPTFVRFASWVGGDMDGNPNVSAATIRATLARQRDLVLGRYRNELDRLYARLSQTRERAEFSAELEARIAGDPRCDEVLEEVPPRHRDMPYRVLLTLMHRRLGNSRVAGGGDGEAGTDTEAGYGGPDAFAADLALIADSLARNRGAHAGLMAVRRAWRRVDTFGFHLATLDVRQDAEVHRRVVGALLGEAQWETLAASARAERLRRALAEGEAPAAAAGEHSDRARAEIEATLEVFAAIAESLARYGPRAIGPFIISMARDVDDVLTVLLLARWGGLVADRDGGGSTVPPQVPLDVAPLFETVPDLQAAPAVMRALFADPGYRAHLRARGDRQTIMIGYSDSNKDGGLAASRWALYRGQAALVEALAPSGVVLVFFHGRGGTISRGGSKTRRAIEAAPPGSVAGGLRVTEQGETIHAKYGLRGIALRTLEQATSAVARAVSIAPSMAPSAADARAAGWAAIMDDVAAASRAAYRALVYEDPRFLAYFRQATPIDVIERMAIGSRPASRRSRHGLENLRAIPWVFAWTQSRHILPGWYGLGAGLDAALERHGREALAEMVRGWPFARVLLADVEMVLAKADLAIAARYAALADPEPRSLYDLIDTAFERTVTLVLDLQGRAALLDGDPTLQRAIRLRNPYVDPMSLLQVDLLRRWRATDRADDDLFRALLATVQGIARGLQNTG